MLIHLEPSDVFVDSGFAFVFGPKLYYLSDMEKTRQPRPEWLKVRLPQGEEYFRLKKLLRQHQLNTVCEDALCPNVAECWGAGTATFMILGDVCTRACKFCAVKSGRPPMYDVDEPARVAAVIQKLKLRYAVITSVDRDDLQDGGAFIFAETIRKTRELCPGIGIETLIPDFLGDRDALKIVVDAKPDVLAHNVETVPRLYPLARQGSRYSRSLDHLRNAKSFGVEIITKSSIMLGLGEKKEEAFEVLHDLRRAEVDIVTVGQYLQPTREHLPVDRYYSLEEFAEFKNYCKSLGFAHVESSPLSRSSYHAENLSKF
jgi:lipoyl synthase